MTQTELNIFQSILISKHTELVRELGRRDGIAIVRTPDALDEVQFASARELSTRSLKRGSTVLRDVRAALDRTADGTYGTCLECEEAINKKRLLAAPWATLCLVCQEQAERKPQQGLGSPERLLREAA
jgi:DnaK suppressor protein